MLHFRIGKPPIQTNSKEALEAKVLFNWRLYWGFWGLLAQLSWRVLPLCTHRYSLVTPSTATVRPTNSGFISLAERKKDVWHSFLHRWLHLFMCVSGWCTSCGAQSVMSVLPGADNLIPFFINIAFSYFRFHQVLIACKTCLFFLRDSEFTSRGN